MIDDERFFPQIIHSLAMCVCLSVSQVRDAGHLLLATLVAQSSKLFAQLAQKLNFAQLLRLKWLLL